MHSFLSQTKVWRRQCLANTQTSGMYFGFPDYQMNSILKDKLSYTLYHSHATFNFISLTSCLYPRLECKFQEGLCAKQTPKVGKGACRKKIKLYRPSNSYLHLGWEEVLRVYTFRPRQQFKGSATGVPSMSLSLSVLTNRRYVPRHSAAAWNHNASIAVSNPRYKTRFFSYTFIPTIKFDL